MEQEGLVEDVEVIMVKGPTPLDPNLTVGQISKNERLIKDAVANKVLESMHLEFVLMDIYFRTPNLSTQEEAPP